MRQRRSTHTLIMAAVIALAVAVSAATPVGAHLTKFRHLKHHIRKIARKQANQRINVRLSGTLKNVRVVKEQTVSDSSASKNISAECPPGTTVVGGGAGVLFGGSQAVALSYSGPPLNDPTPETEDWHASASEIAATSQSWALQAVAYCARVVG